MKKFDKEADREVNARLKKEADLPGYARELGMKHDPDASYSGHHVYRDGDAKYDIYQAQDGNWLWHERKSGEGGDIFKLHTRITKESFAEAKNAVLAYNPVEPSANAEQRAVRERQSAQEAKEKQAKREAEIHAGTAKARTDLGFMNRRDTRYLESRGISPEVLAETRWRTNSYGSACFPNIDADKKTTGYEYRGFDYQDKKTGEDKQAKGFTTDTLKGVYVANGRCENPTEMRFCEGGVDTLSAYQLATPEERQRILFVGTTGETGPNTEAAIKAMAERNGIQKFSMAYDRDKGGDQLTQKRTERLSEAFADAEIRDVREEMGMQQGEDPNDLLRRRQAEQQQREALDQQHAQESAAIEPAKPTKSQSEPAPEKEPEPEQTQTRTPGRSM